MAKPEAEAGEKPAHVGLAIDRARDKGTLDGPDLDDDALSRVAGQASQPAHGRGKRALRDRRRCGERAAKAAATATARARDFARAMLILLLTHGAAQA